MRVRARSAAAVTLAVLGAVVAPAVAGFNAVVVSPDNRHVYVASRSGDAVAAFSRNTTTGDLTSIGDYFDGTLPVDGLDGAEDIAVSPDAKHVYVAGQDDNAVAVFERNIDSGSVDFGKLTFVEAKFDGAGGVNGLERASSVALDPSGDNVYVAAERGLAAGDWLAVFSRDSTTGALTSLQSFQSTALDVSINCSGIGPSDSGLSVSPNGLFVAVAEPFRGAIATFSRSAVDGTLILVESICDDIFVLDDGIGSVVELAHSPDGKNLYSAGGAFETLATIDSECASPNVDLALSMDEVNTVESETACRSITAGTNYSILPPAT